LPLSQLLPLLRSEHGLDIRTQLLVLLLDLLPQRAAFQQEPSHARGIGLWGLQRVPQRVSLRPQLLLQGEDIVPIGSDEFLDSSRLFRREPEPLSPAQHVGRTLRPRDPASSYHEQNQS
jgi:hypothetical protein